MSKLGGVIRHEYCVYYPLTYAFLAPSGTVIAIIMLVNHKTSILCANMLFEVLSSVCRCYSA